MKQFRALAAVFAVLSLASVASARPIDHGYAIRAVVPSVTRPVVLQAFLDPATPLTQTLKVAPPVNVGNNPYPTGAVNGADIWGTNGATVYKTASLAGLVANTPVNVIAATTGKQIVVVGYNVSSNVAGSTVVFQDETGTPVVYDGCTFAANDHIQVWRGGAPIIITAAGAALDIAITGTSDVVKGSITYYLQ